jgi:hypothetical protein
VNNNYETVLIINDHHTRLRKTESYMALYESNRGRTQKAIVCIPADYSGHLSLNPITSIHGELHLSTCSISYMEPAELLELLHTGKFYHEADIWGGAKISTRSLKLVTKEEALPIINAGPMSEV